MSATKRVKVQDLEPDMAEMLLKFFPGQPEGNAFYGEEKYLLPNAYKDHVDEILNMNMRKDDIWVATFPRCGTTWTQELTWLINNNLDYEKAAARRLTERYLFIEIESFVSKAMKDKISTLTGVGEEMIVDHDKLVAAPSPRFIKTHLPFSLLPPRLLDTSRVVYVARNPRDVAVSYYHHNKLFKMMGFTGDFKDYWNLFRKDLVYWAPFFSHVKEAWAQRNHPNMLFLFYEDLSKDLPTTLRRVAKFFGKNYNDEQIQKLSEHVRFDKMKENKSVHPEWMQNSLMVTTGTEKFFRKGKAGGWRDYFDDEMTAQADAWVRDNLRDTDLRFPDM